MNRPESFHHKEEFESQASWYRAVRCTWTEAFVMASKTEICCHLLCTFQSGKGKDRYAVSFAAHLTGWHEIPHFTPPVFLPFLSHVCYSSRTAVHLLSSGTLLLFSLDNHKSHHYNGHSHCTKGWWKNRSTSRRLFRSPREGSRY